MKARDNVLSDAIYVNWVRKHKSIFKDIILIRICIHKITI